jgi:hypothetical protein
VFFSLTGGSAQDPAAAHEAADPVLEGQPA